MIARKNSIRLMAKGETALGEDGIMANRPFENAENDFHVSNKLDAPGADMEIDGILASECTGV